MATATGRFPNRPYQLRVEAWVNWQSGVTSNVHFQVWVDNLGGTAWSGSTPWGVQYYDNFGNAANASGTSFDWRGSGPWLYIEGDRQVTGSFQYNFSANAQFDIVGSTSAAGSVWIQQAATVPATIGRPTASNVTPTSMTINWNTPSDGGSPIDQILLRRNSVTPADTSPWIDIPLPAGTTSYNATGLTPGTTYYWTVYAHNGVGYSIKSPDLQSQTLVSAPPTVNVVASAAGTSAVVTLGPPGGAAGVTQYDVTYTYTAPAPIPNPPSVTVTTTTSPITVSGLIPGATYSWTATASFGSAYTSPASTPIVLTQPKPTTTPGNYFDGNTPDTPDADYAWTGSSGNSTSTVTASGVLGWTTVPGASGATSVLSRRTGGFVGTYSALNTFIDDATTAGFRVGTAMNADITSGGTYWGSIHVYLPRRSQRLAAVLVWSTNGTVVISTATGVDTLVPAASWTRLSVIGTAPSNADWAGVQIIDVSGADWATWKGGDQVYLDGAMVSLGELYSYFDGDTPDTANYDFQWTGTANASASIRESLSVPDNSLVDPDCPPIPAPPRPPIVPSDCVIDVGSWRRTWAYLPAAEVNDWLTTLPTLELTTTCNPDPVTSQCRGIRQVRIRYYQDPFGRSSSEINTDDYCSEQILSYIPPNTVMTVDAMVERVYAEVSGGPSQSADHLLYGSNGTPAAWPHLSCGIGYWVSVDVPTDTPVGVLSVEAFITLRS